MESQEVPGYSDINYLKEEIGKLKSKIAEMNFRQRALVRFTNYVAKNLDASIEYSEYILTDFSKYDELPSPTEKTKSTGCPMDFKSFKRSIRYDDGFTPL